VLLNKTGKEIIKILIGRHVILIVSEKPMCADTRSWDVDNPEKEIREANRNLQTRLMQIVTRRNLNVQLARDTPSVSELVDVLATKGVIPTTEGTKSRQYADTITRVADRVDRGERITQEEFVGGEYTTAILWFDTILPDIER
jgi:hypothetical protein